MTERPKWREDFPYEAVGEETVTRREFARYLVLASGAFAVGNLGIAAIASLRPPLAGEAARIASLDEVPVGGSFLFRWPDDDHPAILLRPVEDQVIAFSQKCTHLGCVVYYEPEHELLECPCHEGFFDAGTGRVVAGPPTRDLPQIAVEIRDDEVWTVGGEVKGV